MKKLLFITISFFLVTSLKAQDFENVIKGNPIGFTYSFNVTYEKPLSDSGSAFARFRYYYGHLEYKMGDDVTYYLPEGTMSLKAGYRFYVSNKKDAPNGFFLSPTVNMHSYKKETIFGAGGQLGYQWAWDSGFVLDLYSGVDVMFDEIENVGLPVGGVALGYAF